jgi:Tol biopolymer transport system component
MTDGQGRFIVRPVARKQPRPLGRGLGQLEDRVTPAISLVSAADPTLGLQSANGYSEHPSVSADGRYVAFWSTATNLAPGQSYGGAEIYVKDTLTGVVTLVSCTAAGVPGNSGSFEPSISANGRYVAFISHASNLVPGDTNGMHDVFVKDTQTGALTRASTGGSGEQANSYGYEPSISADGRYVAFWSIASNLVPGDTNENEDVFVKDTQTGATTRVSTSSSGAQGEYSSRLPSISADGRYVAFISCASDLVPGDTNAQWDVFVKDTVTGVTTRVSTDSAGVQGNDEVYGPSISSDGRYVAFQSEASNLVPGDTNGLWDVFVKDTVTGATRRVSTDSSGAQSDGFSERPSISENGRYVAFISNASNLVPGDPGWTYDMFVKDTQTGATTRVSTDSSGGQGSSEWSLPAISADGRYVAFYSYASNLAPGDTNEKADVFVKDTVTGATKLASAPFPGQSGDSGFPSVSADGRFVAFESAASNLVPGDTNGAGDVFVKDTITGATTRVSTAASGAQGNSHSSNPSVSADGRFVAFQSDALNLVVGDAGQRDIFVKDTVTGATMLISTNSSGAQGDSYSERPSISADGRFVAFRSSASNLVPDDTNGAGDVFVKDTVAGAVQRVSTSSSGAQGDAHSGWPAISAGGRFVAFNSIASNLVPGDENGKQDAFLATNDLADLTPPVTTITRNPGSLTNDATPTFEFAGDDGSGSGVVGFEVSVDGGLFAAAASPFTTAALSDGSHTLAVRAKDAAGNIDASPEVFAFTVDTAAPTVTGVTSDTANGAYGIGSVISIQVGFSEAVAATGTPTLALNSGGTARYTSGSGTNVLTFTYTVAAGESSGDLDYADISALSLNGGQIRDTAANGTTLALPAPGGAGSLGLASDLVIDGVAPSSAVAALPATVSGPVVVTWGGQDSPDIAGYNVYVSDNGAAYTLWQDRTTSTSGTYAGTPLHTYDFYSVAIDQAGNQEPAPTSVEASTTVVPLTPTFVSAAGATFSTNRANAFTFVTTSYPTAAYVLTGPLPDGATFVDNGDGTATLSGTPAGPAGAFSVAVAASNGFEPGTTQTFTLTVDSRPAFTSTDTASFVLGAAGTFSVTTNPGLPTTTLAVTGKLPYGVRFNRTTGVLSGTPAAGTDGAYPITFTATNGSGSSTQTFKLNVLRPPKITSVNRATFAVGQAGAFTITGKGFPSATYSSTPCPRG